MRTALDESMAEKSRAFLVGIVAKTGVYPGMAGMGRVKPEDGGGRRRRILGRGNTSHCYHVMSRTCGGEVLFDEVEREALAKLLSRMRRFCPSHCLTA